MHTNSTTEKTSKRIRTAHKALAQARQGQSKAKAWERVDKRKTVWN